MNRVCSLRALVLALVLLLSTSLAFAQSDLGSISGFVKDPSRRRGSEGPSHVKNEPRDRAPAPTTNDSGYYTVTNIPAGLYTITAEAAGFKKYETTGNKLDPSAALAVDAHLGRRSYGNRGGLGRLPRLLQTESAAVPRLWLPASRSTCSN